MKGRWCVPARRRPKTCRNIGFGATSVERTSWIEPLEDRTLLSIVLTPTRPWVGQGPTPITDGQTTGLANNPVAGAVSRLASDPLDSNILYAGTVNGGVWKTTNANSPNPSWTPLTDQFSGLSIGALEFDPTDPTFQTLVAGEGGLSSLANAGGPRDGLLRTTDGGATWTSITGTGAFNLVGKQIVGLAARGQTLVVAVAFSGDSNFANFGIFRSTDGGNTFTNVALAAGSGLPEGVPYELASDPSDPNLLYTNVTFTDLVPGQTAAQNGIYRSDDAGATWVEISSPAMNDLMDDDNTANVKITVGSNENAFVGIVNGGKLAGIFQTSDISAGLPLWTQMDLPEVTETLQVPITGATNGAPVQITSVGHRQSTGDRVLISGVGGNTAANGTWTITVVDADHFTLDGSDGTGSGTYTAGTGVWQAIQGLQPGESFDDPVLVPGEPETEPEPGEEEAGGQGSLHFSLAADPNNPNLVYIGGDRQPLDQGANAGNFPNAIGAVNFTGRLFRGDASLPSGSQWTPITDNFASGTAPHADSRKIVIDAQGNLIESDDGGIYKLTNPTTTGGAWASLNGDLQITEFHSIAYDDNTQTLIGGAQDTGAPFQDKGATTWTEFSQGDGGDVAVDTTSTPGTSIRYSAYVFLQFFTISTWDSNNQLLSVSSPTLTVNGTGGLSLLNFDPTLRFYQPFELNKVAPKRMLIPTTQLYVSSDQGNTLDRRFNAGTDHISAVAYGGRSGGVDNPDIIYIAFDDQVLRSEDNGATFTTTSTFPGDEVFGLVLDPEDWHSVYVLDKNNRVFHSADSGVSWEELTGNLPADRGIGFEPGILQTHRIEFAGQGAYRSIVVGNGSGGVYRMFLSLPSDWNRLGPNLPNAPVDDLEYNAKDDVLVVGTQGRGAWTFPNYSAPDTILTITGDEDSAGENDTFRILVDPGNPALFDVFVNGGSTPTRVPIAALQKIVVNGLGGNDTLVLDSTNGPVAVPSGIAYDGGTGSNSLTLQGGTATSDSFSTGTGGGQGTSSLAFAGGSESVTFQNLTRVLDTVTSPLTVAGDANDDTIKYKAGAIDPAKDGLVTIDTGVSIEFSNKATLAIRSGAGDDSVTLDNSSTPTGLTSIAVDGEGGTDGLTVNAFLGAVDVSVAGAITIAGLLPISYANFESIQIRNAPDQPLAPAPAAIQGNKDTQLFNVVVGGFSDGPPSGGPDDFTATIDWGDGSPTTIGQVVASGNAFQVLGTHTYHSVNTFTIKATVNDLGSNVTVVVGGVPISIQDAGGSQTVIVSQAAIGAPLLDVTTLPISGVEGTAIPTGTVLATFTDPNGATSSASFAATIDFGSGAVPAIVSLVAGSTTTFQVTTASPFTYQEEGAYDATLTITDTAVAPATVTSSTVIVTIADAPLAALPVTIPGAVEGAALTNVVVAQFTDGNPFGTVSDFTASIDWGDGSATSVGTVSESNGVFSVKGSHTYAHSSASPFTITVAVADIGGSTLSPTATIAISDAPLTAEPSPSLAAAVEGHSTGSIVVAQFTDGNPLGTVDDFTAAIDWGDGSATSAGTITGANGVFSVSGSHIYADESANPFTITVFIADVGGSTLNASNSITVDDAPLTAEPSPSLAATVEGQSTGTIVVAQFTDGNPLGVVADFSATIDWGDGSATSTGTVTLANGVFSVAGNHTYADESTTPFTITVAIADVGGSTLTTSNSITVNDAPLTQGADVSVSTVEGQATGSVVVAQFTDGNPLGVVADFSATIDWGDGSATSTGTVALTDGVFSVAGNHTYADERSTPYTIIVSIADFGGSTLTVSTPATVADAPLSQAASLSPSAVEGKATGSIVVGQFTDGNPAGTVDDFTATIDWGDGSATSTGTITLANGVFSVAGNHTYAEERVAPYVVTISIADVGGSTLEISTPVLVSDAPLTSESGVDEATERVALASDTIVATFTDANPNGALEDFTATIDWGDGSPTSAGVIAVNPGGSGFVVRGTHTYADSGVDGGSGSFKVTTSISDVGGSRTSVSTSVSVDDVPISLTGRLSAASDAGTSNSDGITNVNRPVFNGSSEAGSTIRLFAEPTSGGDRVQIGQGVANSGGTWTITSSLLADGEYVITASAVDESGHTTASTQILPASSEGHLTIDTVGPKVTGLTFGRNRGTLQITFQDNASGMAPDSLLNADNYVLSRANARRPRTFAVTGISLSTPTSATAAETATVTFNGGRSLPGSQYLLTVSAAGALRDVAGNSLDGEFAASFPSGNGSAGGPFSAQLDTRAHQLFIPGIFAYKVLPLSSPTQAAAAWTQASRSSPTQHFGMSHPRATALVRSAAAHGLHTTHRSGIGRLSPAKGPRF